MRIAHTADIHVRGLTRHSEYRETFQAFADECRSLGVDHIAIEGDIFHTKTSGLTPEYIEFLTWWLKLLADAVPGADREPVVHVRLGNHDGNLVNSSRQDAVSPIIEALGDPRVRLYKKSGTYRFADGFNWCVFGIFDRDGWASVDPTPGEVNIACYHGPVAGASSESDWTIDGVVTVDFFSKYDFAFLGDIHKRQHLAFRDHGRTMPWISYPGTPVQQNYAESTDRGFLLWDIKDRENFSVTFRQLPNRKPFITLDWRGDVDSTLAGQNIPRGARCRVRGNDHVSQRDMAMISSALAHACAPSEVTFKLERPTAAGCESLVSDANGGIKKTDLRSAAALVRLLKEHHRDQVVTDAEWSAVERSLESYLISVGATDDTARNVRWNPLRLKFDNMFSYGPDNVINFDALNGVVGIFGQNRGGKSSIVGTMMYSLFNTTDRGAVENMHVINARHDFCRAEFIFHVNGSNYVIERQTVKHDARRGPHAVTSLNAFRLDDGGELHDLCGEQRRDTERVVRSLIGTAPDFQLTSLAAQGDIDRFIREGSTQRRHILARFLDIDVFEKMCDCARDESKALREILRRMPKGDPRLDEAVLVERLSASDRELLALAEQQAEIDERDEALRTALASHAGFTPITQAQIDSQVELHASRERERNATQRKIASVKAEIASLEASLEKLAVIKKKFDIVILRQRLQQLHDLERSQISAKHVEQTARTELARAQRSLLTLDGVPCGNEFPTCKFIKNAIADRSQIPTHVSAVSQAEASVRALETESACIAADDIPGKIRKHDQAVSLDAQASVDLSRLRGELQLLVECEERQRSAVSSASSRLDEMRAAIGIDENTVVVGLRADVDSLKQRRRLIDDKKTTCATARGRAQSELEKCRAAIVERDRIDSQLRVYDLITSAFSKRGIPSTIIAAELPVINAEIAKILHGIVDFTVELAVDEDGNSMDVVINYGDSRRLLELGSGMEKFISCIAIRVALTIVSSLPKTDFFIIDEGFGSLDDSSIESCGRLIQSLKRYFRTVIIISHQDGIKDVADSVIEITKVEKDSKVVVP